MSNPKAGTCARCGVTIQYTATASDGALIYSDIVGGYCCDGWHGHDEHGVYAPNHTLDPDEDSTAVLDYTDGCRPTEDGWTTTPAFVTSCCGSPSILQDAYVNPNFPGEVASMFDNFVCDNEECDNFGTECSCINPDNPEKWKAKA